jgi:hypothetical protein
MHACVAFHAISPETFVTLYAALEGAGKDINPIFCRSILSLLRENVLFLLTKINSYIH